MISRYLLITISLTITFFCSCKKKPLPIEKASYVGWWDNESGDLSIIVNQDGSGKWIEEESVGGGLYETTTQEGRVTFKNGDMKIAGRKFSIDSEPDSNFYHDGELNYISWRLEGEWFEKYPGY